MGPAWTLHLWTCDLWTLAPWVNRCWIISVPWHGLGPWVCKKIPELALPQAPDGDLHITQSADIRNSKHTLSWPFPRFLMVFGQLLSWALKKKCFEKPGSFLHATPETTFVVSQWATQVLNQPYEHLVKTELAQLQKVLLQQHTSHGYVYLPYGTCVFNAVRALEPHWFCPDDGPHKRSW